MPKQTSGILFTVLVLVLFSNYSFGRTNSQLPPPQDPDRKNSALTLSGVLFNMNYAEQIPPPIDTETGLMPGVNLEFLTKLGSRWFLKATAEGDFGSTKYTGALQSGSPLTSTTHDNILDGEIVTGPILKASPTLNVIPYAGFATHYWNRQLTGVGAYAENYLFFYVPIGIRFAVNSTETFSFAVDASFLINLGGTVQVLLSQLVPPERDAQGSLGSAVGVKIQVPLLFQLTPSLGLNVDPFFEYFGIGAGSSYPTYSVSGTFMGNYGEPASSTFFYGMRAGISYLF